LATLIAAFLSKILKNAEIVVTQRWSVLAFSFLILKVKKLKLAFPFFGAKREKNRSKAVSVFIYYNVTLCGERRQAIKS